MLAPQYITKELKEIDGLFFTVFNPRVKGGMSNGRGRWQVRKWVGNRPKKLDLWNCYGYSDVIMTICKEAVTEKSGLIDIGYEEMDRRVVTAIRKSNHWKNQWKQKIADMDWRNEKKERQANAQLEYEAKAASKSIYRVMHEPQVYLSGKEWKV